jgi:hypothetical protein
LRSDEWFLSITSLHHTLFACIKSFELVSIIHSLFIIKLWRYSIQTEITSKSYLFILISIIFDRLLKFVELRLLNFIFLEIIVCFNIIVLWTKEYFVIGFLFIRLARNDRSSGTPKRINIDKKSRWLGCKFYNCFFFFIKNCISFFDFLSIIF